MDVEFNPAPPQTVATSMDVAAMFVLKSCLLLLRNPDTEGTPNPKSPNADSSNFKTAEQLTSKLHRGGIGFQDILYQAYNIRTVRDRFFAKLHRREPAVQAPKLEPISRLQECPLQTHIGLWGIMLEHGEETLGR